MSDLIQEHITKPKSDDMSMDEILASIRKIISTSSEETKNKPIYNQDYYVAHNQTHKSEQALSAREQLLALTKPNLYDSDFTPNPNFKKIPDKKIQSSPHSEDIRKQIDTVYQKPFYDTLNKNTQKPSDTDIELDDNHDADILKALNDIRESLGHTMQSAAEPKGTPEKIVPNPPNTKNGVPKKESQDKSHSHKDAKIVEAKEATFDDITLRSNQFTGDAVPEFLKKFKRQQEQEKQKLHKKPDNPQYDFSKLSNFDENDEILTLTEKIMPMSKQELSQHEEIEKTAKRSFERLRQGTEEIMKRATERKLEDTQEDDDSDDCLSPDDTPMVNVIVRTLKPMLQEWINENMHQIAEQVLRQEFRRGLK